MVWQVERLELGPPLGEEEQEGLAMKRTQTSRWSKGATMVEYGLMVALIALICAITVGVLGGQLDTVFQNAVGVLASGGG